MTIDELLYMFLGFEEYLRDMCARMDACMHGHTRYITRDWGYTSCAMWCSYEWKVQRHGYMRGLLNEETKKRQQKGLKLCYEGEI